MIKNLVLPFPRARGEGREMNLLENPLALATQEFLVIHTLCDRAGCPRTINGELLSASQRVTVLENVYRGLISRVGMNQVTTIH